jgi:HEAT repeat protein
MPIVKRGSAGQPGPDQAPRADKAPGDGLAAHIAALSSADADTRWRAARALGEHAEAVAALAARLAVEDAPRVREAIMTALMRVGSQESVQALLPFLRSQDAGRRAAAIEALQALPDAIAPFMAALLGDNDSDVRILATELARNMPAAQATRLLCGLIEHETHPNVCAAAIDVLAEVGTRDAVGPLQMCADRFAGTAFLPFAVSIAIARISGTEG